MIQSALEAALVTLPEHRYMPVVFSGISLGRWPQFSVLSQVTCSSALGPWFESYLLLTGSSHLLVPGDLLLLGLELMVALLTQ